MAPSIQQLPEEIVAVLPEKLVNLTINKDTPKVKRQIEEEGGSTDATACSLDRVKGSLLIPHSTHSTSQPGTMPRNILLLSLFIT
jgi:hypothetical protein